VRVKLGDSCGTYSDGPSSVNQTVGTLEVAVRVKLGDSCGTYSNGPSSVNQTVGTLEVAVRVKVTLVQVFHSFGDVSHQRQLKSVVQLDFVVHQYVLYQ